ncbi:MAG TPA: DUF2203 family protein [Gemmataceae bacterium]|nr:DUF2203 family protein [Gemmataceae bacterium]
MKRNRKGAARRRRTLRAWDYDHARAAVPYLTSILRSLRELYLEAAFHSREASRLADRPGRPDRHALIAREEALQAAAEARRRFDEALTEMEALDVFCLDPVKGQALIPFVHDNELAWYVLDLFDKEPLRFWRYHTDPLETRRPVLAEPEKAEEGTWLA